MTSEAARAVFMPPSFEMAACGGLLRMRAVYDTTILACARAFGAPFMLNGQESARV
jgi:hypothetical protein